MPWASESTDTEFREMAVIWWEVGSPSNSEHLAPFYFHCIMLSFRSHHDSVKRGLENSVAAALKWESKPLCWRRVWILLRIPGLKSKGKMMWNPTYTTNAMIRNQTVFALSDCLVFKLVVQPSHWFSLLLFGVCSMFPLLWSVKLHVFSKDLYKAIMIFEVFADKGSACVCMHACVCLVTGSYNISRFSICAVFLVYNSESDELVIVELRSSLSSVSSVSPRHGAGYRVSVWCSSLSLTT
jgi:hypothetical protein